ncbi:hypothetical protein NC653_027409 [Populus alba x Populus x berolinensis]|uniref:Ubiquitin-like modifier-activating enzyme Atg7 N-terminal domain-containing protein n=1 Tax=Populus alba x Populus x berolinensis TaxID=444605 RepID=A0AAD6M5B5_9ROSI|nr:hypothetical protein NC653_027409 [Populus alba x Populus x berolinensis]
MKVSGSSLKLNKYGIDDSPIAITGFYAPCSHSQVSNHLTLLAESLPLMRMISLQCQHSVAVTGTDALYPGHFIIQIHWRPSIPWIKGFAKGGSKQDIHTGRAMEDSVFVFPVLVLDPPAILIESKRALEWFASEEARSVSAACNDWHNSSLSADMPFFLISIASNSHATIRHLKDREACQADNQKDAEGIVMSIPMPGHPVTSQEEKSVDSLALTDRGVKRLGCYFCNDVVAPTDVVSEYRKRGIEFLLQALNHPTYLEDLTGLTELKKSANSFKLDWDDETDDYNDDELFKLVIQDK